MFNGGKTFKTWYKLAFRPKYWAVKGWLGLWLRKPRGYVKRLAFGLMEKIKSETKYNIIYKKELARRPMA